MKPPEIVVETVETSERQFVLLSAVKAYGAIASFEGEKKVCLDLVLEDGSGEQRRYVIELDEAIDPYILASDLQGCADNVLRRAAIDAGLDTIAADRVVRDARRMERIARRQLRDSLATTPASTCDFCPRTTAFVIDGKRYCKRCAEEHGVRPTGKIT